MPPYWTGSGTAANADFSAYGRTLVDDADAATARTTLGLVIGTNVQAYGCGTVEPGQRSAGFTSAADKLPYFTGAGTAALATFTAAAGLALVDDADALLRSARRLDEPAAPSRTMDGWRAGVAITGGTIRGLRTPRILRTVEPGSASLPAS